jgi:hypothetical protein
MHDIFFKAKRRESHPRVLKRRPLWRMSPLFQGMFSMGSPHEECNFLNLLSIYFHEQAFS